METPKPGIYHDVPFETYLKWDAISNSRITLAMRSLLHFKTGFVKQETKSMRLGTFLHCGVLEPLAISMRYAVMPAYELNAENVTKSGESSTSKATSYYIAMRNQFIANNLGKQIVEKSFYDLLVGVSKALSRSERAREYLGDKCETEVSAVWVDEETGLLCKCRYDSLNTGINDLKSTADAMKFTKSIANFGYHRQGAHYQDGWVALTGEVKPVRLIAVEPAEPFGTRSAPVNEDAIDVGRSEVRTVLRAIADAKSSGNWTGYEDPSSWCLPAYYGGGDDEIELTVNGETILI